MKNLMGIGLVLCSFNLFAAELEGAWQTINEKDGKPESIVRIERQGNEFVGTIEKLLRPSRPNPTCDKCPGEFANKPIESLKFFWGLQSVSDGYDGGSILDPAGGSIYRLKAFLSPDGNTLTIRGYLGISLLGRSQSWQRVHTKNEK